MAINNKVKVAVVGAGNKSVLLNPQATEGAVFGKDLFFGDGSTVVTLQNLATALGIMKTSAQPNVLWNQLAAIPPNVIQVANLATAGVVRRLPDGTWITQPPTDFTGRPGAPGRRGDRGPPGVPGVSGPSGARGVNGICVPGRRGVRGRQGFPGPPGAAGTSGAAGTRGADGARVPGRRGPQGKQGIPGPAGSRGATGPAGTASTASGFPGYRQKPVPKHRLIPSTDSTAGNVWPQTQTFLNGAKSIVLEGRGGSVPRVQWNQPGNGVDQKKWQFYENGLGLKLTALNDAESAEHTVIDIERGTATAVASITFGNTTDTTVTTINTNQGTFSATANQTLIIANANANAQTVIEFKAAGTAVGRIRSDFAGNMNYVCFSGGHTFYKGGDSGVGVECITISGAATTGGLTAALNGTNFPGASGNAAKWLPVKFGGVQFYIPMFS